MKEYDAIVLGKGIAGLGVAYALVQRDLSVLVLHKNKEGESSLKASGILDPLSEFDSKSPMLALTLEAFKTYPAYLKKISQESGADLQYLKTGMLCLAHQREDIEKLNKNLRWQKKKGVSLELLQGKEIQKKVGDVLCRAEAGLYYPDVGRVFPENLLRGLTAALKKKGVKFQAVRGAVSLWRDEKVVKGVRFLSQKVSSRFVVNAAGAWAKSIHKTANAPVVPARGQIVVKASKKKINCILQTPDWCYVVPWKKGQYVLGSTIELKGYQNRVTELGKKQFMQKIKEFVPEVVDWDEKKSWAGLRPMSRDHLPLIGQTLLEGYYMAAGYFRSGILVGMHAGELLAKTILEGKIPSQLKAFDPRRF